MAKWQSGASLVWVLSGALCVQGCDWVRSLVETQRAHSSTPAAAAHAAPAAPQRPAMDEAQVLAWVANEPITIDDFTRHREAAVRLAEEAMTQSAAAKDPAAAQQMKTELQHQAGTLEAKKGLLKQLVRDELLYQDALARNLQQDSELQRILRDAQRNLVLQKARQRIVEQAKVDAAAVAQFYEANKAYFKEPDRARLRVIVVATQEQAKALMAQLYGGADFAQLAQEQSLHESKPRGGEWGPIIRAQERQMQEQQGLPPAGEVVFPALETLVFAEGMKDGSVTAPVEGPDGRWWIAMVVSREPGRQKQLVEVQDAITGWLQSQAYQQALEAYVAELETRAANEGRLQLFEQKLEQIQ